MPDYITSEVRAIIGAQSEWIEAPHPVEAGEVRRIYQGSMDPEQKHRGERSQRYGREIAPLGFVVHLFRRPLEDAVDPLDIIGDSDFDGTSRRMRAELPRIPITLPRVLNGGFAHEFHSYAFIGDRVRRQCRYKDITQHDGKSGTVVIVAIEEDYVTTDGRPLQRTTHTSILR